MLAEIGILSVISISYAHGDTSNQVALLAISGLLTICSFALNMFGLSKIRSYAGNKLDGIWARLSGVKPSAVAVTPRNDDEACSSH